MSFQMHCISVYNLILLVLVLGMVKLQATAPGFNNLWKLDLGLSLINCSRKYV